MTESRVPGMLDEMERLLSAHLKDHPGNYISFPGERIMALVRVARAAHDYVEHYNNVGWEDACHPTNLEEALKELK